MRVMLISRIGNDQTSTSHILLIRVLTNISINPSIAEIFILFGMVI